MTVESFAPLFEYSDFANAALLDASKGLSDAQLDTSFDMGMGTLRKTLKHILDGEAVWLARWKGEAETPWPPYETAMSVAELRDAFAATSRARGAFVAKLKDADLARVITYRDSKGSLFSATLGDMLIQGFVHSTHHRAQAVNMLRRLGAGLVELDYMTRVRKAVT
ncbi:DinB family protein [Phycisphaerae bacterium RAS2]|nr:DinB family protein [Phycisphaerae bacterium RAS2]